MTIFIPNIDFQNVDKKSVFLLARPFLGKDKWVNDDELKDKWFLKDSDVNYVEALELANFCVLPLSINEYLKNNQKHFLEELNVNCKKVNIKILSVVTGDFGICFPEFSNIIYFRYGGFASQLSKKNTAFPVGISDHFQRIFEQEEITPRHKNNLPTVGFCGHASTSKLKAIKELLVFVRENCKRLILSPFKKKLEPLFASSYQRAMILKKVEKSNLISSNFIYRNQYRAGISNREQTTFEYFDNILNSDYILCLRGTGNFSVRFYETLMMGRIPIFVNTDCLLPFDSKIDWKKHVVWIEWEQRANIAQMVSDFHSKLSDTEFKELQLSNRKLWKETLSIDGIFKMVKDGI